MLKFLGTSFIKHELDKSLKIYDTQLTQRTETLKTQLSIYAHEQNIALSRIDTQRAEAIHKVYAALRDLLNPASKVAYGSPLRGAGTEDHVAFYSGLCEVAQDAALAYMEILGNNAIYIDIETYEKLIALATEFAQEIATILTPLRQGAAEEWSVEIILEITEELRAEFASRLDAQILPLVQDITCHFRKLLGTLR